VALVRLAALSAGVREPRGASPRVGLAPLAIVGLAGIVVLLALLRDATDGHSITNAVSGPAALAWTLAGAAITGYLLLRPLWARATPWIVPRTILLAYAFLIFVGAAGLNAIRLAAEHGYPIASTARLPGPALVDHAVAVAALGGLVLVLGVTIAVVALGGLNRPPRGAAALRLDGPGWLRLHAALPVLLVIGLLGAVVITAANGQLPILAQNIDQLRYRQAAGLGFASLFEYELLLGACIAGITLALAPTRKRRSAAYLLVFLACLIVFRAERSPLVITVLSVGFAAMLAGRRLPARVVLLGVLAGVAFVVVLGLVRFVSSGPVADSRELVVRPLYDAAPELREQAFVYQVYPDLQPYLGSDAVIATASAFVPGRLLSLVGVDKSKIYTDASRSYAKTMQRLGYYPNAGTPLRTGIVGELWADFGPVGVGVGLLALGLLVGRLAWSRMRTPHDLVRQSVVAALVFFALVTPLGALVPIALMLLVPLWLMRGSAPATGTAAAGWRRVEAAR